MKERHNLSHLTRADARINSHNIRLAMRNLLRRQTVREFTAEFLATMVLIMFGDGVVAQVSQEEMEQDPTGGGGTTNIYS